MLEVVTTLLEKAEGLMEARSIITANIARRNGFGEELDELIRLDVELYTVIYHAIQVLDLIEPSSEG